MSRLHDRTLELLVEDQPPDRGVRRWLLQSPAPGWFHPTIAAMAWCQPGAEIGALEILGRRHRLVTPPGVAGFSGDVGSGEPFASRLSAHAVAYRDPIVLVSSDPGLAGHAAPRGPRGVPTGSTIADAGATGLVFRAPTSGRFYGRSAPDKPPFVAEGAELTHGATICLLEVMKTFHRVTYGGADLPATARVIRVLVADGADVNAGDPLLALG